ncbi:MAG: hypothetical protein ACSHYA_19040 [Opitutaceae bacterium]
MHFQQFIKLTIASLLVITSASAHDYAHTDGFINIPEEWDHLGDGHGEVDVASNGEIYLSVQKGAQPGLQVYSATGDYLRNVPGAAADFHGFVIQSDTDGEYIYGVGLNTGSLTKLQLNGDVVFQTPVSAIPEKFVWKKDGKLNPRFTSCAVAPDGTIYVVDGYGTDNVHLFNKDGSYRSTWIGKAAPYNFNNLHKIYIDPRYEAPRILACDRANRRLVHLTLDGEFIGEFATALRRPSAAAFYKNNVAIAEIEGRISILDLEGKIVSTLGTNNDKYNGNRTPPEKWRTGITTSPHGIAYDANGNILMTEYSKFGRVLRYSLEAK